MLPYLFRFAGWLARYEAYDENPARLYARPPEDRETVPHCLRLTDSTCPFHERPVIAWIEVPEGDFEEPEEILEDLLDPVPHK